MQDASALDERMNLFELIKEVSSCRVDYVKYLRPTNEADAMVDFLANDRMIKPNYRYGGFSAEKMNKKRAHIRFLLDEIRGRKDLDSELKMSFTKDLGQSWYYTELIASATDYNNGIEKSKMKRRFERASDAAFGRMHPDTFWSLMRERIAGIDVKKLKVSDLGIYHEMLGRIGVMGRNRKKHYVPDPDLVKEFGRQLRILFKGVIDHIPKDKKEFTPIEAVNIFNEIIEQELNMDFHAEVDESLLTASTHASQKKILIPGGRHDNYTRIELEKLIIHELGVHAVRAYSAEMSSLPVAAFPKSGTYSRLTEEGLAKVCEQALDGKYDDICIVRYLSIGLAQVCKKNFRETFEILWRLEHLVSKRTKEDCFSIVQRTFRGTGELPINTDLFYYRGYALVWQYVGEHIHDGGLAATLFLSGKNDFLEQKRETLVKTMREDGLIN
ncbi:DUF1704 domain-containing protein [Candidatus Saccharibacteria bacterium]|nr:DUF1704 domain-containing protein [Candidatus Saccharibacteria bacterium]